jgi:hypothetical protein
MATLSKLVVKLGLDSSDLQSGFGKTRTQVDKFAKSVGGGLKKGLMVAGGAMAAGFGVAAGAATIFTKQAVDAAGDAVEMMSKFEVTFGGATDSLTADLVAFGKATGRNRYDLQGMAADTGAVLKAMGLAEDTAASYSGELTKLAVDVGSFNNADQVDVMNAFRSAMTGEFESMKKYGIIINQTKLDQELLNMGIQGGAKAASQAEKSQATYNLIMQQTADAQGDAERTSGSWANQMVALKARFEETKTAVGMGLLPVITPLLEKFNAFAADVLPLVVDFLVTKLIPGLQEVAGNVMPFFVEAFEKISAWIQENRPLIEEFWALMKEKAALAWEKLQPILNDLMNILMGLGTLIMQVATGDWTGAWETIQKIASDALLFVEDLWVGLADWIGSWFGTSWEEIKTNWQQNWDMFTTIVSTVWDNIKREIMIRITVLKIKLNNFWNEIKENPAVKLFNKAGNFVLNVAGKFSGQRATGGDVWAGQSYVVGERRAELFTPRVNGYISPSLAGVGGGGAPFVFNYSPTMSLATRDEAIAAFGPIYDELRRKRG